MIRETGGDFHMRTSGEDSKDPISRGDFFRTAALAATAVGSGIAWAAAKGQPPAIDDTLECSPLPGSKGGVLEPGAQLLRGEAPLAAIGEHVCGLHFYSGDINRQVMAQHYCSHVSRGVRQCVIYDSDKKHARLVGIEYIISAELFAALPAEEKKLWHSHVYEVKSGQLIAPRISEAAEKEVMRGLIGTYGKTWYTWQVDRGDQVPLGIPQLLMAFTADGQADPRLLAACDREYGISAEERKKNRADIDAPGIQPGADVWQKGGAIQLQAITVGMKLTEK